MNSSSLPGPPEVLRAKVRSQMSHVILTLLMSWAVATLTHRREVMIPILAGGWAGSVFMFAGGAIPFWRILCGVAVNGILFYFLVTFVLSG